ncbi:MAG: peptidylprolyl isomerase [Candidatus Gottesmanbacteria bacterium]|nr:peptidylprolyl isomerase [Candidatus Gottesmanbacteria bacterium]
MWKHVIGIGAIVSLIGVIGFLVVKPTPQPEETRVLPSPSPTQAAVDVLSETISVTPTSTAVTPTPMTFDMKKSYTAILHTEKGDITIVLNARDTPKTAENFVTLARKSFYDGTVFHRVIRGFMIQGGDPKGDGTGGPGYKFADEPITGEYNRGTVAMANSGPNTNGSQFFIMHADTALQKDYVIFGRVTKGLDVVDAIATAAVKMSPSGEDSTPVTPVKVTSVDIIEK